MGAEQTEGAAEVAAVYEEMRKAEEYATRLERLLDSIDAKVDAILSSQELADLENAEREIAEIQDKLAELDVVEEEDENEKKVSTKEDKTSSLEDEKSESKNSKEPTKEPKEPETKKESK
ncbi:uncharacterized protein SAPINGB_P001236 [Magnusiomyces paraingens]|uniref:Uncharacterized protein n=1 Tax=Magnusiomyces paraingens TaxID=2606893 RepID=A0A5E8BAW8_9ASCO|nr:uncharacterized protein SAPINGB_P001236 [Saprochaete ingens]VVT46484.1 unnamed protein product [Saprochaete ingens]